MKRKGLVKHLTLSNPHDVIRDDENERYWKY